MYRKPIIIIDPPVNRMDKVNLITLNKFLFLFLYKNLITMYNVDELSRLLLRIGDNSFS